MVFEGQYVAEQAETENGTTRNEIEPQYSFEDDDDYYY